MGKGKLPWCAMINSRFGPFASRTPDFFTPGPFAPGQFALGPFAAGPFAQEAGVFAPFFFDICPGPFSHHGTIRHWPNRPQTVRPRIFHPRVIRPGPLAERTFAPGPPPPPPRTIRSRPGEPDRPPLDFSSPLSSTASQTTNNSNTYLT